MWKTVFDCVIGTSHRASGTPCQDACRVVQLAVGGDKTVLVLCTADGAGSATHAEIGSECACDTFVRIVQRDSIEPDFLQYVSRDVAVEWCQELRAEIENRAQALGVDKRQLATTFLAALIGETSAVFLQIGDGAMVYRAGDTYLPAIWPQSGEFANTTNFLTDDRFAEALDWRFVGERIDEAGAFSDGLERLILRFADRSVHAPFLVPLFETLRRVENPEELFEPLRTFLDSAKINERSDDDKTLVLATRLKYRNDEDAIH